MNVGAERPCLQHQTHDQHDRNWATHEGNHGLILTDHAYWDAKLLLIGPDLNPRGAELFLL